MDEAPIDRLRRGVELHVPFGEATRQPALTSRGSFDARCSRMLEMVFEIQGSIPRGRQSRRCAR